MYCGLKSNDNSFILTYFQDLFSVEVSVPTFDVALDVLTRLQKGESKESVLKDLDSRPALEVVNGGAA